MGKETRSNKKVILAEYDLHLYITGATPKSLSAVSNIKLICDTYLKGKYSLKIIDVYKQLEVAREEQLIALPLLVKRTPLPERRLIGDMSDTFKVLKGLGLNPKNGIDQ